MKIKIINGPNLNLLGTREPEIYGRETLESINSAAKSFADRHGIETDFFQSNHEGEIIDEIQKAFRDGFDGIIINPGGYTHTSVSIRDAIAASPLPVVEVHLSNIFGRENFRRESITAPVCKGVISGFGRDAYILALAAFIADKL